MTANSAHENEHLRVRIQELEKQIDDRRRFEKSLEERLQFEKLLSEISSVYANLSASAVGHTIEHDLQRIGQFLSSDRCILSQYSKNGSMVRVVHSWANQGVRPLPSSTSESGKSYPWVIKRLKQGKVVNLSSLDDLPAEAATDRKNFQRFGTCSHLSVPIAVDGSVIGSLSIGARNYRTWPDELVQRLRLLGEIFANAMVRKEKDLEIRKAFLEINKLKEQLEADCSSLREEIELEWNFHRMIGQSEPFRQMIQKIQQISPTDITVLIHGETGTGKELVARAIHNSSPRRERPVVKVNCAALPSNLIESELFGHEKGAFTSAQSRQIGRFELANGNTLFLDEIGELPLESQAKLLRVIQEGEFERLGSSRTIKVDVRIIAATNRDLEDEVQKGRFRQDLWYRLNVFPISTPPLRERREDIPLLVHWLTDKAGRRLGKPIKRIPAKVMESLQNHDWPGNVRELENTIERAIINTPGKSLQLLETFETPRDKERSATPMFTLEQAERNHIVQALTETKGRIYGAKGAALLLDLNPSTLRSKIRKFGIEKNVGIE